MGDIQESRFYKLSEVMAITGIPQSTLTQYAREGRIKAVKMGKIWRMTGAALQELLTNGTTEPRGQERSGTL